LFSGCVFYLQLAVDDHDPVVFMFPDSGQVLTVGTSGLFAGLLIIFIGWLIDEARKIREEQELTV
jgi:hypothetical protein